jgi:hypothetical protein
MDFLEEKVTFKDLRRKTGLSGEWAYISLGNECPLSFTPCVKCDKKGCDNCDNGHVYEFMPVEYGEYYTEIDSTPLYDGRLLLSDIKPRFEHMLAYDLWMKFRGGNPIKGYKLSLKLIDWEATSSFSLKEHYQPYVLNELFKNIVRSIQKDRGYEYDLIASFVVIRKEVDLVYINYRRTKNCGDFNVKTIDKLIKKELKKLMVRTKSVNGTKFESTKIIHDHLSFCEPEMSLIYLA